MGLRHILKLVANELLGTISNNFYWKYRHLWDSRYPGIPNKIMSAPQELFLDKIGSFDSLLEMGCGNGSNLQFLAQKNPQAGLIGVDISHKAIDHASRHLSGARCSFNQAKDLRDFPNGLVDVVISSAVLIYIHPHDISGFIAAMLRVARRKVVLCEQHKEIFEYQNKLDTYDGGNWVHDYEKIIKKIAPNATLKFTKISPDIWGGSWGKYGYIIEITK